MSFSTPGMLDEQKTYLHSAKNMSFANTNSKMFQMKPTQDLGMFQASQIRNPWAQQQVHTALMPTNPQQLLGMSREWGTSYVSPEVEMHIVSQPAETPENTTKNSNNGKENNTQNTWTSAEELANAIFPTNIEANAAHATQVHHGLLNHKLAIESLRQEAEANTTRASRVHTGLMNHKMEIEQLKTSLLDLKTSKRIRLVFTKLSQLF